MNFAAREKCRIRSARSRADVDLCLLFWKSIASRRRPPDFDRYRRRQNGGRSGRAEANGYRLRNQSTVVMPMTHTPILEIYELIGRPLRCLKLVDCVLRDRRLPMNDFRAENNRICVSRRGD